MQWHFPKTLDELGQLMELPNRRFHSGGTALLRTKLGSVEHMIDLRKLNIGKTGSSPDTLEIGAMTTYEEASQAAESVHLLSKALRASASTPLRNRITIGGSISQFPVWSDLMGPLMALDANVVLYKEGKTVEMPITDFVAQKKDPDTLITKVRVPIAPNRWHYHRQTRTKVDYPMFTITVLARMDGEKIGKAHIIVVGTKGKFTRATEVEKALGGNEPNAVDPVQIAKLAKLEFADKKDASGAYLAEIATVQLERSIAAVLAQ